MTHTLPESLPQLSWVLPLYCTAECLAPLLARIREVSTGLVQSYEVILVDDACPQGSGTLAEAWAATDPHVRVLRLPANRGQDNALRQGLSLSRGEWTVIMDADLQDPPEAVRTIWPLRMTGVEAVFANRTGRYHSGIGRRLAARAYRSAIAWIGGLPTGACLFALLSRPIVDRIRSSRSSPRDSRISLLAQLAATRGRFDSVAVQRAPRFAGTSAYTTRATWAKAARSLWQTFAARRLHRPVRSSL